MTTAVLGTRIWRFCIPSIYPLCYRFNILPYVTASSFSGRKMSTCFGGLGLFWPPIPMTFEDVHDPVYLAHSPIPCRFLLACSRFY